MLVNARPWVHTICCMGTCTQSRLFGGIDSSASGRSICQCHSLPPKTNSKASPFDLKASLDSDGLRGYVRNFKGRETLFAQGDLATSLMYIREGGVKLTVVNESGKEAVVTILGVGDFPGEGCLAGQKARMGTATTIAATAVLVIEKKEMIRALHERHEFADHFITYML
jgi:CRP/FNR family cyclic AMP-dependent transcriptional regulator